MRFIDKKGRLFGKINIVDFFIILLLIIIIPGFFSVYKILGRRPSWVPSKWIKVEAVAFTIPEITELIKPDRVSSDRLGHPHAKVLRILERGPGYGQILKSTIRRGDLPEYEERIPVFLEMELFCSLSAENEPYYFMRKPLLVSMEASHNFKTLRYEINFYVLKIKD